MGFYDGPNAAPVADKDPTKTIQWQIDGLLPNMTPFTFIRTILTYLSDWIRSWPVIGQFVSPFLDALADMLKIENPDPAAMIQFLTDPVGWAKRIIRFVIAFVRGFGPLSLFIEPFLAAIEDLLDETPETLLEFLFDPVGWSKRIFRFFIGFLRGFGPLSDFIAPFLDAVEDLIDDVPSSMLDFLDPIKWAKILTEFIVQFIKAFPVLGTLIAPFLDAIQKLVEGVPDDMLGILNPATWMGWIFNGFLGQFGIDFSWLAGLTDFNLGGDNFFTKILGLLGNPIGFLTGGGLGGLSVKDIPLFGPMLAGFINGETPFNVGNLFGILPGNLFGFVPIGALTNEKKNLLPQGMFPPGSLEVGDGWEEDTTRTATADSTYSARHVADGKRHALRSIELRLPPGKKADISVKTLYQSLTGTGQTHGLGLLLFKNEKEVGRQVLQALSASGTSAGWTTLSGTYTMPEDGSVDMVKVRPFILNTASSGWINFDDAIVELPDEIEQDWVTNLIPQWEGVRNLFNLGGILDLIGIDPKSAWGTLITSVLNPFEKIWNSLFDVFGGVLGSTGKTLASLFSKGKDFFDTIAGGVGSTFAALTSRMNEGIQLVQALAGQAITPITSLIQTVLNRFAGFNTSGLFDASFLRNMANIPTIVQDRISGLVTDLGNRLMLTGNEGFSTFAYGIARFFTGNNFTWGTSFNSTNIVGWGQNYTTILSRSNDNLTNLDTTHLEHLQTKQILAKQNITPINGLIQSIYNFWF